MTERYTAGVVAGLLGVKVPTIYSYVSRGVMPTGEPCPCCGSGPTWDANAIKRWAESRPGRTGRPKK